MKIIKPGFEFITPINGSVILKRLEECGRVCYKSEGKITDDSAPEVRCRYYQARPRSRLRALQLYREIRL